MEDVVSQEWKQRLAEMTAVKARLVALGAAPEAQPRRCDSGEVRALRRQLRDLYKRGLSDV